MSSQSVNSAYVAIRTVLELQHIEDYIVKNNTDEKQLQRLCARPWIGCSGSHRFGMQWDERKSMPLHGNKYRYLDQRLQPWMRQLSKPFNATLERKPKRNTGRLTTLKKMTQSTRKFWPTPEESYNGKSLVEFPAKIVSCVCGLGATCHKASPPAPQVLLRMQSDPVFSSRPRCTCSA